MARAVSLLLFVAAALLCACTAKPEAPLAGLTPAGTASPALLYQPSSYRLSEKVTLTVGRRVFCFNGYVAVRRPGLLRATAFGEMGGRMFDFLVQPQGGQVLFKPERLPPKPLQEGVLEDMRFLFLSGEAEGFNGEDGRLALARQMRGHRLSREARFMEYRPLSEGATWQGPGRVVLTNHLWHYRMEIETLSLNPEPPGDKIFSAGR